MIPKRSTRGQREPSKAAPPPLPAGKGPRPGNYDLIESIVGLQVRQAPLEMLAEHALPLLLKAFGAAAGALLVHHRDDGTLRLIASSALAEAGRKALECLRPGAGGGWEIPLHGLLNRKAYIIERPHEHPFVPQLVERGSGGGPPNLASIPLYRGQLPVGVLLVIAERAPLTEAEIVSHVLVYDVLSLALEAGLRARGQAAAAAAPADGDPEEQGLRCEEWVDSAAVARQLEVQVAGMTRERDALASRLGEIEARYSEVVRALESQVAEHTRILETERAEATRRLAERAREAHGQHAEERTELVQRLGALEQRLAEERAVAEATRARLESELAENAAALEARVQTLEATLREREDALVTVRTECDRLRQAAVTQDDVVGRLSEEMEARGARAGEADATHRRELEHARASFEQELGELRAAHAQELGELRATAQRELLELRESSEHKLAQLRAGRDRERSETRATHEHELAELRATHESMLAQLETAGAEACARAAAAERREADLAGELLAMREEVGRLGGERERVRAALGGDGVEPVAAIESLHARVVALAAEVRGLAEERDEIARCAVEADEASTTRFASEQRAREEQRAGHERALGELRAAHRHELEELYALHRRELEESETALRAQLAEARAEAQRKLDEQRADAQQRVELLRAEAQDRLDAVRTAQTETLARATSAETRAATLETELAEVRSEAARLSEERAHVLAAVDDPGAEPATVIRALRDQVVALEGQLGVHAAERAALERRLAAEAQATEARIADLQAAAETRLGDARAAAQASLEDARAAAATTVAELRALLAERDAALAERDAVVVEREAALAERERALASAGTECDRSQEAVLEATAALRERQAEVEQAQAKLEQAQAGAERAHVETEQARAALAAAEAHAQALEGRIVALDRELAGVRAEAARLEEERARVIAAVEDQGAEPAAVIRALREQVEALEGKMEALAAERGGFEAHVAAERTALSDRLAAAEHARRDAEQARTAAEQARAVAEQGRADAEQARVEAEHSRTEVEEARVAEQARAAALASELAHAEELLAAASRERARDDARSRFVPTQAPPAGPGGASGGVASSGEAVPPPPRIEVLSPPPVPILDVGRHRLLESDPDLRERVGAAFTAGLEGAPEGRLFVANVLTALSGRLAEVEAAAQGGAEIVLYAADARGRSRVLGAVRWLAGEPTPADFVAAVDARARGPRRIVTLSDDVDALLPARNALSKAGHSVSMACETKQAIDLLAILTPDVVLVDLRNAPAALVAFFEALELEGGHVLVLLVHGDAEGKALATVVERLMRSVALDPEGLTRTCAAVLAGPPVRTVPSRQRPQERVKANIRKLPLAPRATAKRR